MQLLMRRRDGAKCTKEHTHQSTRNSVIASRLLFFPPSGGIRLTSNIPTVAYII